MPYADAFLFDVFISFAREDNEPRPPEDAGGWITRFVHDLLIALNLELGEKVGVFFDRENRFGGLPFEYLRDNIRHSAVFVPLVSPAYFAKGWAEFRAFMATPGSIGRIAPAEIFPIVEKTAKLEIAMVRSIRLWVSEEGRVRRLSQKADPQMYSLHMARLANQIVETLRDLEPKRQNGSPGQKRDLQALEALKGVAKEAEKEFPKKAENDKGASEKR
jgi:hypothetical protein